MDKRELKIGNYVECEKTTHIISELHRDRVIHYWTGSSEESDGYVTSYDYIFPIKVTDDILKKFGFINGIGIYSNCWKKEYKDGKYFEIFYLKGRFGNTNHNLEYKYVHELQQIYQMKTKNYLIYED